VRSQALMGFGRREPKLLGPDAIGHRPRLPSTPPDGLGQKVPEIAARHTAQRSGPSALAAGVGLRRPWAKSQLMEG
jgi:hypothetical protein